MNGKSDKKSLFEYCPTVVTLLKINFLLYSLLSFNEFRPEENVSLLASQS